MANPKSQTSRHPLLASATSGCSARSACPHSRFNSRCACRLAAACVPSRHVSFDCIVENDTRHRFVACSLVCACNQTLYALTAEELACSLFPGNYRVLYRMAPW